MHSVDVLDCLRNALWVILKLSGPFLFASLILGLVISFLQALTQIQEMTLAFIPKILGVFFLLLWLMPYIGRVLQAFSHDLFTYMLILGKN